MSSILETFYLLFESDAKKAAKDLDNLEKTSDNVSDSLEETTKASKKQENQLQSLTAKVKAAITSYVSLQAVQAALQLSNNIDLLGKQANMWGLNVEKITSYGEVSKRYGGSIDSFSNTIIALNASLNEVAITGQGSLLPFFNMFGISAIDSAGKARDAFEILPELADYFQRLSKSESATLGHQLGLDDATIRMLQAGRREVDILLERQRRLGSITKEQAEISAALNDEMADTSQTINTLGRVILTALFPSITIMLSAFTNFLVFIKDNEDFTIGFFATLATIITIKLIPAIISLAKATSLLLAPLVAIGTVFGLFLDEIQHWRNGQKSILGEILGDWNRFSDNVGLAIDDIVVRFKNGLEKIKKIWVLLNKPLFKSEKKGEFDFGSNNSNEESNELKKFFGISNNEYIKMGQDEIINAQSNKLGAITSGAISNISNVSGGNTLSIGEIRIQTQATSAEGIASDIRRSLSDQMKSTLNSFDDGVLA